MPDAEAAVWRTPRPRRNVDPRRRTGCRRRTRTSRVLREAMARDTLEPVGVTFGTQTGQLWHSADGGERWRLVTADLPPIWAVEAVPIEG